MLNLIWPKEGSEDKAILVEGEISYGSGSIKVSGQLTPESYQRPPSIEYGWLPAENSANKTLEVFASPDTRKEIQAATWKALRKAFSISNPILDLKPVLAKLFPDGKWSYRGVKDMSCRALGAEHRITLSSPRLVYLINYRGQDVGIDIALLGKKYIFRPIGGTFYRPDCSTKQDLTAAFTVYRQNLFRVIDAFSLAFPKEKDFTMTLQHSSSGMDVQVRKGMDTIYCSATMDSWNNSLFHSMTARPLERLVEDVKANWQRAYTQKKDDRDSSFSSEM
jgi:hypothetical protein